MSGSRRVTRRSTPLLLKPMRFTRAAFPGILNMRGSGLPLRSRGHRAELDVAESQSAERVQIVAVLVESGRQAERVREAEPKAGRAGRPVPRLPAQGPQKPQGPRGRGRGRIRGPSARDRQRAARGERNQTAYPGTGSTYIARSRRDIRIGQRQGRHEGGERLAERQMLIRIEMNAVDRLAPVTVPASKKWQPSSALVSRRPRQIRRICRPRR